MTTVTQDRFRGAMLGMAIGERIGAIAEGITMETPTLATTTALTICRRFREFRRCDPMDVELAILAELAEGASVPPESEGFAAAALTPVALWYAATNSAPMDDMECIAAALGDDDDFKIGSRAALIVAIRAIMAQAGGSPLSFHLLYDLCGLARRFEREQTAENPPAPEESTAALLDRALTAAEKSAEFIGLLIGTHGNHAYQTVPMTLAICALHDFGRFQKAVVDVVKIGGAKAARGALAGALVGARVGLSGIPKNLVRGSPIRETVLAAADEIYALATEVAGGMRVAGVTARASRSNN